VKVTGAVQTDRGRVRRENQDSYGFSAALGLYLVADGMGGQAAGKRASEEAAAAVTSAMQGSAAGPMSGGDRLRHAIDGANRRVWELAQSDAHLRGMGTTIAAVLVDGDVAHIGHVGDSRVYRIRDGTIQALTRDHSLVTELVDRGVELPESDPQGPYGSVLTRAVGVAPTVEVELASDRLQPGDVFVICSDGVYRGVEPAEIQQLVLDGSPDLVSACNAIVARANAAGGLDNSTVIVLRATSDDRAALGAADGSA
jgi:PPM family protein phosphatase